MKKNQLLFFFALGLVIISPGALFAQGPLTPPAGPTPTMKSLAQIEPRTDLLATPMPAGVTTDANYQFIINQPGSYYLSSNLAVTKTNGIKVNAQAVTIDLNGFEISGTGAGNGIEIPNTSHRASIRNGSIRTFAVGINSLFTFPVYARNCAFRDLVVFSCSSGGILVGQSAVVESCRAHDNNGSYAIFAGPGSTVVNCTASNNNLTSSAIYGKAACSLISCAAYGNTAVFGIDVINSLLKDCVACQNTSTGTSAGISGNGSRLANCVSTSNRTTGSVASSSGAGFYLSNCHTEGCTANFNAGSGFYLDFNCPITNCYAEGNGTSGTGDGITTGGKNNRIDSNHCTDNAAYGIRSSSATADFIMRNTCENNGGTASATATVNYSPKSGAYFGPLTTPGNTTATAWSNFE